MFGPPWAEMWLLFLYYFSLAGLDGHATLEGPIEEIARNEAKKARNTLSELGILVQFLLLSLSLSNVIYYWVSNCELYLLIMFSGGSIIIYSISLLIFIYLTFFLSLVFIALIKDKVFPFTFFPLPSWGSPACHSVSYMNLVNAGRPWSLVKILIHWQCNFYLVN